VTAAINQRDVGVRGSSRELADGAAQLGNPKIIAQVDGIKARFLQEGGYRGRVVIRVGVLF